MLWPPFMLTHQSYAAVGWGSTWHHVTWSSQATAWYVLPLFYASHLKGLAVHGEQDGCVEEWWMQKRPGCSCTHARTTIPNEVYLRLWLSPNRIACVQSGGPGCCIGLYMNMGICGIYVASTTSDLKRPNGEGFIIKRITSTSLEHHWNISIYWNITSYLATGTNEHHQ